MREILLTRNKVALVDDADYDWISQSSWYAINPNPNYDQWYAARHAGRDCVYMHRELLGISGTKTEGDHKDRNGLNNQRHNLRIATRHQQFLNMGLKSNNKSRRYGVSWDGERLKWVARIMTPDGYKFIGRFASKEEAARAYAFMAVQIHGDFCKPELLHLAGL